jgi:hypothetical protein
MALHDARPGKLLRDRGSDSADIRDNLTQQGVEPVIPPQQPHRAMCQPPQAVPPYRKPVTKKLPGPIFQCYTSQPQGLGKNCTGAALSRSNARRRRLRRNDQSGEGQLDHPRQAFVDRWRAHLGCPSARSNRRREQSAERCRQRNPHDDGGGSRRGETESRAFQRPRDAARDPQCRRARQASLQRHRFRRRLPHCNLIFSGACLS